MKITAALSKLEATTKRGRKWWEEGAGTKKRRRDGCYSSWHTDQARTTMHRARLYLSRQEFGPAYKIL